MVKKSKGSRRENELQFYAVRAGSRETYTFIVEASSLSQALCRAIAVEPVVHGGEVSPPSKDTPWALIETEEPFSLPLFRDGYFKLKVIARSKQSTAIRH